MLCSELMCAAIAAGVTGELRPEPAPVYVMMTTHFDHPWSISTADLESFGQLSILHPEMKWTHLFNPVAYTQSTPLLPQIEDYLVEARDVYGAEIGLHLHMFKSYVEAAGVEFHDAPSFNGSPPGCGSDASGYAVPMTSYSPTQMHAMLHSAIEIFALHDWNRPRTFCAGYYAADPRLQAALADLGFTASAAAFPPGTEYGAQYGPCWYIHSGWGDGWVTHTSRPYLVSRRSIMPHAPPPYLLTGHGPLIEIPQVCKIDWMVSAADMQEVFLLHYNLAATGRPTAVCLAVHDTHGDTDFGKFHAVLNFIDGYMESGEVPVVYATASEIRRAFLPLLIPPGDVDGDGLIDVVDLLAVLAAWGPCHGCPEDLNHDAVVDVLDLLIILAHWS